jgi:hypothetical protein
MTQTIQPCSWATLSNEEKDLNQTEDNKILLLSVFDSMNELIKTVNKLNYVLQRKKLEHILYQEDKKEGEEK